MTAAIEMPTPINFSDNAVKKVKELIEEEGTPDLKLRVFVSGGGCSGFQYGFTFEETMNEDDTKVEKDNVVKTQMQLQLVGVVHHSLRNLIILYLFLFCLCKPA